MPAQLPPGAQLGQPRLALQVALPPQEAPHLRPEVVPGFLPLVVAVLVHLPLVVPRLRKFTQTLQSRKHFGFSTD